jgi:threonine dehydratase
MRQPSLESLEDAARIVYGVMPPTPQICWPQLGQLISADVWVKHENHTPVGAFKIRGGLVYFHELVRRDPKASGVVAATRGNHGQSIAVAARRHGLRSLIVVPHGNSPEKNAAMKARGAELIEYGEDFQAALEYAEKLASEHGLHMVPSFDEALVRGVASYSLELFRAVADLETVYVPIGLGSGVCGAIAARNCLGLKTDIVGVVAAAAPAYLDSYSAKVPVSRPVAPTIADGMACRVPSAEALEFMLSGVSRIVSVEEDEIKAAMRHMFSDTHNVAEGAGAAALAAAIKEGQEIRHGNRRRRIAVVQTGGNVDKPIFAEVLSKDE